MAYNNPYGGIVQYFSETPKPDPDFERDYGAPNLYEQLRKYVYSDVEEGKMRVPNKYWELPEGSDALITQYASLADPWKSSLGKYSEGMARRSADVSTMQAGRNLSKAVRGAKMGSLKLQDSFGKMGFRGGESGGLSQYLMSGVQRAGHSASASAQMARLGMLGGVYKGRADYADSLWDLYGDFLASKPGRIAKKED